MSRIRLSVTENVLSDPGRITRQMYEDYLESSGRGWVAEIEGEVAAFSYADKHEGSIWPCSFIRIMKGGVWQSACWAWPRTGFSNWAMRLSGLIPVWARGPTGFMRCRAGSAAW